MFPKFDTDFEPRAQSKDNGSTMSGTSSTFEIRKRRADRCGAMKEACVGATGDLQNHDHDPQTTVAKACSMGARLKVIYRRIADLHLDSRNPRVHSQKQIRQIAKSIEACGFNVPMLVDESSRVVAGHGRFLACQQLACSEVPTIALEHLSEAQTRAFMIADNRLTENSSWDDRFLAEQLKELSTLQKGSTPRRRKCASG